MCPTEKSILNEPKPLALGEAGKLVAESSWRSSMFAKYTIIGRGNGFVPVGTMSLFDKILAYCHFFL